MHYKYACFVIVLAALLLFASKSQYYSYLVLSAIHYSPLKIAFIHGLCKERKTFSFLSPVPLFQNLLLLAGLLTRPTDYKYDPSECPHPWP